VKVTRLKNRVGPVSKGGEKRRRRPVVGNIVSSLYNRAFGTGTHLSGFRVNHDFVRSLLRHTTIAQMNAPITITASVKYSMNSMQ